MALTVLQKLKLISDAVADDQDNLKYVDVSSEFFMNSLPEFVAQKYYVPIQVTDGSGLECGTKYGHIIRDGIPCREGITAFKTLYDNASSRYGANVNDPVWYKEQGKVFIKPDPTAQEPGYVASIPRNFITDYTAVGLDAIPNTPSNAEHVILLFASFLILSKQMRDSRSAMTNYVSEIGTRITNYDNAKPSSLTIADFTFSGTIPSSPAISISIGAHTVSFATLTDIADSVGIDLADLDLSFDVSSMDSLDLQIDFGTEFGSIVDDINDEAFDLTIDTSSNPPSLDLSGITFPNVDLADTYTAIENAYQFIGSLEPTDVFGAGGDADSGDVPKGAFWLDDEDPEMVRSAVDLAAQEVNRANAIASSQLSNLQTYKSEIDAKIAEFRGKVEGYSSQNQLKVEEIRSKIQLYQSKIQGKSEELRARIEKITAQLTEVQAKIQKELSKLQLELQSRDSSNQVRIGREELTVAEFQARVQNYSAKLNKVSQDQQLKLQEWSTRVNQEIQENQLNLQKYQNDLASHSQLFQTEVGEYTTNLNKDFKNFENDLNLALSELQILNGITSKFQVDSSTYTQLVNEANLVYQQYNNEYAKFLGYESKSNN